jgi:hypothetical protein
VNASSPTEPSAPSSSSPIGSTPTSPSPVPTVTPMIQIPDGAPTTFGRNLAADRVPVLKLLPSGAQVTGSWTSPPAAGSIQQIAVAWARGSDPFGAEHGFELWQRFTDSPPWRLVYGFTDEASRGVLGIRVEQGDVSGDAVPDALTFEDQGGSGACGVWRVVQSGDGLATQIFRKKTCDTQIEIASGSLRIRAAVYGPNDAHCCPSKYRTTILAWRGNAWEVQERVVTPA